MKVDCPSYGSHHWQLDRQCFGRCNCGAERDFQEKEKHKTYDFLRKLRFETEFYNQGKLDRSSRIK